MFICGSSAILQYIFVAAAVASSLIWWIVKNIDGSGVWPCVWIKTTELPNKKYAPKFLP